MEGLDIVVGGHTNTFLWDGPVPDNVGYVPAGSYPTVVKGRVLVVQTNGYGRYLGRLDVDFDPNGNPVEWHGNPLLLNQTYAQDQALQKQVEILKEKVASKMDTVVRSNFPPLYTHKVMNASCSISIPRCSKQIKIIKGR